MVDAVTGPGARARRARRAGKNDIGVTDDTLSAELDTWPAEAPPEPKTVGDRARLALIRQPGVVRLSDWATTDRARANRRARSYTTADPRKLDPAATGTFEARVYHDTGLRKYRVAVRYTPTPRAAAPPAGTEPTDGHHR